MMVPSISKGINKLLIAIHLTLAAACRFQCEKNDSQFKSSSLDLSVLATSGWVIRCRGGCPVHCRIVSRILVLY